MERQQLLSAFQESLKNVFERMFASNIEFQPEITAPHESSDYIGVIAMSMTDRASLTVNTIFPIDTGRKLVGTMLGMDVDEGDDELLIDGIAELANVIAGAAKTLISQGSPIELGLPYVLHGNHDDIIQLPSAITCAEIYCASGLGAFSLALITEK